MNKKKILITGGTGLIGSALSKMLTEDGYEVAVLTRTRTHHNEGKIKQFEWDIEKGTIEKGAVEFADYIVHLAGSNIGAKRWTKKRREKIINSRTRTADMLFNYIEKSAVKPLALISSSASGYYGAVTTDKIFTETDPPGDDFQGKVCQLWESSADKFSKSGLRVVKIRSAVVLSSDGGVIRRLYPLFKMGLGASIGSGRQYFPWIHINDICRVYKMAIEDKSMSGAYNAVSPHHVNNEEFSRAFARALGRRVWLPNVPGFFLRIALGEMSDIVLKGSRLSPGKLINSGFSFRFNNISEALKDQL